LATFETARWRDLYQASKASESCVSACLKLCLNFRPFVAAQFLKQAINFFRRTVPMRVTTKNGLRCSRREERPGLIDRLHCNNRTVVGPNRAFDYHDAIFALSAIGHDNHIIACWSYFAKLRLVLNRGQRRHGFRVASVIPEPSTLVLLVVGGLPLLGRRFNSAARKKASFP